MTASAEMVDTRGGPLRCPRCELEVGELHLGDNLAADYAPGVCDDCRGELELGEDHLVVSVCPTDWIVQELRGDHGRARVDLVLTRGQAIEVAEILDRALETPNDRSRSNRDRCRDQVVTPSTGATP